MSRQTRERRLKESIAIVGDGFVEHYYFQNMRDYEEDELRWVDILPRLPEATGSFDKAINKAIDLVKEGRDQAFAIVDLDKVFSDGKEDALKAKKREVAEINTDYEGKVYLCYCNPCFEYWFLLHFGYTAKLFGDCSDVENELSNEITDYEKSKEYHSRNDLYSKLRDKLVDAMNHGKTSRKAFESAESDSHPVSTVQKIFFELQIGTDY